MEMLKYKNIYVTYFWQGNTTNGNGLYCLNFFEEYENNRMFNINQSIHIKQKISIDKKGNLKSLKYGSIEATIKNIIDKIK
jgi:hypothetical protein